MATNAVFVDGASVLPATTADAGWSNTALPGLGAVAIVRTYAPALALEAQHGGDDAPGRSHRGWDRKRATLKRKREEEFTSQIRDIYRALVADPQTAAQAEAIVAPVVPSAAASESETDRALDQRAAQLRQRADALDAGAMQAEIALRLLYREMRERQEAEDFEAVRVLLAEVL